MYRGTTPTNTITVDLDLRAMTVFVTYSQGGRVIFEKTNSDITIETERILVPLTQEDTLALSAWNRGEPVLVQIRAIDALGNAVASNIMTTTADAILKDGEIEYAAPSNI